MQNLILDTNLLLENHKIQMTWNLLKTMMLKKKQLQNQDLNIVSLDLIQNILLEILEQHFTLKTQIQMHLKRSNTNL